MDYLDDLMAQLAEHFAQILAISIIGHMARYHCSYAAGPFGDQHPNDFSGIRVSDDANIVMDNILKGLLPATPNSVQVDLRKSNSFRTCEHFGCPDKEKDGFSDRQVISSSVY